MIPIFLYHKVPPDASFEEDGEREKQNLTVVLWTNMINISRVEHWI